MNNGPSLAVKWWRFCVSTLGLVGSIPEELRSHMPCDVAKKTNKQELIVIIMIKFLYNLRGLRKYYEVTYLNQFLSEFFPPQVWEMKIFYVNG